jgi:plasmid replication initiation protein
MSDEVVKSLSNRAVAVQSNSMINSKYELSEVQQKLILLAIAQIKTDDEKFFKYSCSVAELEERLGVEIKHRQFRDTCEDLFKKPIRINNGRSWKLFNWFSSMQYIDEEARFEFKISDDLIPYLLNLKKHFTAYNIEQALFFKGKYTTRFYQFLIQAQHQQAKKRTFALEELYELLQLPPTFREYKHFKSKVLEPSLAEINAKSDIKAAYEPTKKLRKKVLEITIYFDFKDVLEAKTQRATAAKNFKKYAGREFVYFGALLKIDYIQENEEKQRIEAIYTDPKDGQQSRADFDSLEHLEQAIRKAKELKADMKSNPDKYEKKDRDLSSLF